MTVARVVSCLSAGSRNRKVKPMRKPDVKNLKNHLPQNKPIVHKGHAVLAASVLFAELAAHMFELSAVALTIAFGTFSKDFWEAVDICIRKCKVEAHKLEKEL
jgi:hypothetical protein